MFPFRPFPRAVLLRATTHYAEHGWDVVPGACLAGGRFVCEEAGCHAVTCHPANASWEAAAGHDSAKVRAAWHRPYGVLLATGRGVDVNLYAPGSRLGLHQDGEEPSAAPVVTISLGDDCVFRMAGVDRRTSPFTDVVLHSANSWVVLPPTPLPDGRMRWEVDPDEVGWRLPDPDALQALLLTAARTLAPPLVPRTSFVQAA